MIYVDTTHTGTQEGTRSKPLKEIPVFVDGESYHLSGEYVGYFNIDREVKLYGDMLFKTDAGKAIRVEAENVEIHGISAKGYGAHAIQVVDTAKNLKLFDLDLSTDGYQYDAINFQGTFPFMVDGCTIHNSRAGIQIQTDSAPDSLILTNNDISDTRQVDIGGDGDGIFIGGITNNEIDFAGKGIVSGNYLHNIGENSVDLVNSVNMMVRDNIMIGGDVAVILGWNQGGGHSNIVTKNYISNQQLAINSRGGYNCEVYDNDVVNCAGGIWNDKMNCYWNNHFKNVDSTVRGVGECYIDKQIVRLG